MAPNFGLTVVITKIFIFPNTHTSTLMASYPLATLHLVKCDVTKSKICELMGIYDIIGTIKTKNVYLCQKSACWCKLSARYYHGYAVMTPYKSF